MSAHPDIDAVLAGEKAYAIVEGDCLALMAEMPDGSVDHVITDPPYSELVHSKSRVSFGFDHITQDEIESVSDHARRLATRWTLAFCDVESSHLWIGAMTSAGLDYCRAGAWVKIGATPQFTGDRPGVGFEAIVIAHQPGRKKWNGGGSLAVWSHLTCTERGGKAMSNDLRVHPTQKPLSLMLKLVELFTSPGDIILDPFAGSATALTAAVRLGRRAIGFEKNAEHAATARQRLEAETHGSHLKATKAAQGALFR